MQNDSYLALNNNYMCIKSLHLNDGSKLEYNAKIGW